MITRHYDYTTRRTDILPTVRKKVSELERHQTPRIATEFYDAIVKVFNSIGITTHKRFLEDSYYRLNFKGDGHEIPEEKLGLVILRRGLVSTHYVLLNKSRIEKYLSTITQTASRIPALLSDIDMGRIDPLAQIPLRVSINDQKYPLHYENTIDIPIIPGFS